MQHIGTRSAKRKLHKISGKERHFKKDTNHCISKYIISKAKGTIRAIGIEDLKNIPSKVTVRREHRDRHSKWTFGELRNFLTYKSKREGVLLKVINPRNTSTECPKCRYVDKKNRKKNKFECLKCGYKEMSDYVAALNIADSGCSQSAYCDISFFTQIHDVSLSSPVVGIGQNVYLTLTGVNIGDSADIQTISVGYNIRLR